MEDNTMKVDAGSGREERVRVNYPANSQKAQRLREVKQAEKEPVEKVVTGAVVQKKRGLMTRVFGDFVAEDSSTVIGYVVTEVLIPAAKNAISDAVSQGIERVLFGESRPRSSTGGRPSYTNYATRYARGRQEDPRPPMSREARARHDFSDIILAQRIDAEEVIDGLRNMIDQYQVATVSDLYDLVGLTGEFTDDKWGWTDLRSASVRPVRGGYMLNLPRTQPIT
jgi:hypothetical protein